ncbi:hypothetical protein [Algoriphagus hitonicola]|uniref:Uncharacterized protein n=1 Tax=Algoriphagus hitonicola TaxID=435880 RepID=A0A1I2VAR4_9BACT|nr:hypothetical protein [Algoriphagus hitonicola]SFG84506.1 hypothetical protein SAMN04487988_10915 [Algoriphagus hitonicola]
MKKVKRLSETIFEERLTTSQLQALVAYIQHSLLPQSEIELIFFLKEFYEKSTNTSSNRWLFLTLSLAEVLSEFLPYFQVYKDSLSDSKIRKLKLDSEDFINQLSSKKKKIDVIHHLESLLTTSAEEVSNNKEESTLTYQTEPSWATSKVYFKNKGLDESKPFITTNQSHNCVTSIYDKMHKSWYKGVPISYLFQFDIGYVEWAIKNMEDFCVREYDFLVELSTFNKKTFEMKHITHETVSNYHTISQQFSDEEILVAFGGKQYFRKLDVKSANESKLKALGLEPIRPKMFERSYLSYNRSSFPMLSGEWEFEEAFQSAKGSMMVHLKKTSSSYSSLNLIEDKLGMIVNLGPLASFKHGKVLEPYSYNLFTPGEIVSVETTSSAADSSGRYLISKK